MKPDYASRAWAASLTASPVLSTKVTNNAYAALPCAYLVLEGDLTLPQDYQKSVVEVQAQKTRLSRCMTVLLVILLTLAGLDGLLISCRT